jgi:hypothetical protein
MGTLKLHDLSIPKEEIIKERENRFLNLSSAEKFHALLHLNKVAIKLNGGKPLKKPQGKGIVISKSL